MLVYEYIVMAKLSELLLCCLFNHFEHCSHVIVIYSVVFIIFIIAVVYCLTVVY